MPLKTGPAQWSQVGTWDCWPSLLGTQMSDIEPSWSSCYHLRVFNLTHCHGKLVFLAKFQFLLISYSLFVKISQNMVKLFTESFIMCTCFLYLWVFQFNTLSWKKGVSWKISIFTYILFSFCENFMKLLSLVFVFLDSEIKLSTVSLKFFKIFIADQKP